MPRSRGGAGRAPSRPKPAPARPAASPSQQQTRPSSTMAGAPPQQQAQGQQGRSPGLFGQMASTAAGVAIGSSLGHAIGGFFGGSSAAPEEYQQQQQQMNTTGYEGQQSGTSYSTRQGACEVDARNFTQCMDEHKGNMQICSWYLEQLKACQQAAAQY